MKRFLDSLAFLIVVALIVVAFVLLPVILGWRAALFAVAFAFAATWAISLAAPIIGRWLEATDELEAAR